MINENGKRRTVTKLEVAISQLVDEGNVRRRSQPFATCASSSRRLKSGSVVVEPTTQLSETDQKVMTNILKRFQQSLKEKNNETDPE